MTRIYLIRHCEAQGNRDGSFQGSIDCGVTENGLEQLRLLSERFKTVKIDAVYSSPLKRAVFTADAVNKYHGLNVKLKNELREINGGEFEGKPWKELPVIYPEEANRWINRPHLFKTQKGESMKAVYTRATYAILDIAAEQKDRTSAVVSHGCVIRNILCFAKNLPFERLNDVGWGDNTGVSLIEFGADLKPSLIFENDVKHLSEGLLKYSKKFI